MSRKHHNTGQASGTGAHRCVIWIVPRYYFHLRDEVSAEDLEGQYLRDLNGARKQAVSYARAMICNSVAEHGKINLSHRIEVADKGGETVLAVTFGEAVIVER